ncbi:hypothetical protein EIP91_001530 [Steccherinum ochraceum]|uniref:C2H2-type domain-containing protein n=1 Tax=Steccherinum ochraceum TaxID=92696 RepID=A0A4R0RPR2_9APHY|nr:hypothetical protein EIP91_001530 [Steccherinum ochraceum]
MKRSYDYSFVSGTPANNPNLRSFQQPATLAAQSPQFNSHFRQPANNPLSLKLSTFISPTELTLRPPQPWYQTFQASTPTRPPLTGLGISFVPSPSDFGAQISSAVAQPSIAFPLRLPSVTLTRASNPRLPSLRELGFEDPTIWSPFDDSPCASPLYENFSMDLSPSPPAYDPGNAYSTCPADDYTAHLPEGDDESRFVELSPSTDIVMKDNFASRSVPSVPASPLKNHGSPTEPLIGLFADFNMHEFVLSQRSPTFGINPALLMDYSRDQDTDQPTESKGQEKEELLQYPSPAPEADFVPEVDDAGAEDAIEYTEADVEAIVSVLSSSVIAKEEPQTPSIPATRSAVSTPILRPYSNARGLPVPALPTRSGTISCAPSPNPASLLSIQSLMSPRSPLLLTPQLVKASPTSPRLPLGDITSSASVNGNHLFGAHLGIELADLRAKAEEFRAQHPGEDIDKSWLATYAGKLSESGNRLTEFRCYVKGCSQTNKRRDHILVHVGSHVEFRPFQCDHCDMKFLRKNECKRHTTSHGGIKPYVCYICAPYQEKSFVRQDLLKRHIKVTHGERGESGRRRKRVKLENSKQEPSTPTDLSFVSPVVPNPAEQL